MTNREICEFIVKNGCCEGVACNPRQLYQQGINKGEYCPLYDACFVGADHAELAKQWLKKHEEASCTN